MAIFLPVECSRSKYASWLYLVAEIAGLWSPKITAWQSPIENFPLLCSIVRAIFFIPAGERKQNNKLKKLTTLDNSFSFLSSQVKSIRFNSIV